MSHIMNGDRNVWPCVIGGVIGGAVLSIGLAHAFVPSWCKVKKPTDVTLMYFDGRGLAEVARQMLNVAGAEFTDKRYKIVVADGEGPVYGRLSKPEMDADQAAGKFDSNLGRLPVLAVDGVSFGGSKAIYRYIAKTYGLNGSSDLEAAQIDCICELVNDISTDFNKQEDKAKWFNTTSAEGFKQGERQLQWYLEKLDQIVGSDGFAVGGKSSMADAILYAKFGEACITKGLLGNPDSQPMGDGAKVKELLAKCSPKVAKVVATWAALPAMQTYLANRGDQLF